MTRAISHLTRIFMRPTNRGTPPRYHPIHVLDPMAEIFRVSSKGTLMHSIRTSTQVHTVWDVWVMSPVHSGKGPRLTSKVRNLCQGHDESAVRGRGKSFVRNSKTKKRVNVLLLITRNTMGKHLNKNSVEIEHEFRDGLIRVQIPDSGHTNLGGFYNCNKKRCTT